MRNIFCSSVRLWLSMSLLLIGSIAFGQGTVRTGKVTGQADGTGIPGANVSVKGTTRGVTTNASGDYTIQADNGAVLVYSFIGYKAREVVLGNQTAINITLSEDVSTLNEVVVTGYSAQSRRDITGAVATVNIKDLLSIPATDVSQQLQGRVAGVTVTNDATPGGGATVRIRGLVPSVTTTHSTSSTVYRRRTWVPSTRTTSKRFRC